MKMAGLTPGRFCFEIPFHSGRCVGWAKAQRAVPTIRSLLVKVGMLRFAHPTKPATRHACSFCNSFRIASPIWLVLAAVVPSDLMSAVRRPLASTAAIAASTLSASAPMSKE